MCAFDMLGFWKYGLYAFFGLPCLRSTGEGKASILFLMGKKEQYKSKHA
jgi:hypothetical protein